MPTKRLAAPLSKKSDKSKLTPQKPIRHLKRKLAVPKLPEVAPELQEHIVGPTVSKVKTDSYWPALAWLGISLLGILVTSGSVTWLIASKIQRAKLMARSIALNQPSQPTLITAIAPLTGLPVAQEIINRRPWAVVVENFFTVRPQSGLASADIVFESPTEGGITRLVAIYQSRLPKVVGPVRSARSYFNDWIRPFSPFYSHSGGSDRALQQLRNGYGGIIDINEFFHSAAYFREASFRAPHNLFTTPERFFSYLENNEYELTGELPKLPFMTELPPGQPIDKITIPYLPEEYTVTYEYQPLNDTYQRLVNGTTQLDATTNQILTVKNVVVVFTDITPIPNDPLLRVELRTLGQGEARIYTGGQVYIGKWRKSTADQMLEFIDANGQPMPLQPGNTWVSVIDSSETANVPPSNTIPLQY